MLDSIIYATEDALNSDTAQRLGTTASKTLDLVDGTLDIGINLLNKVNNALTEEEDAIQLKIKKATSNARAIARLKKQAGKAGLKLEDFLSEAELKEVGITGGN